MSMFLMLAFHYPIFNSLLNEIISLAGKSVIGCYPQHQPSHRCSCIQLFHVIDISSRIDMPSPCPDTAINLNRYHQKRKGIVKAPSASRMKLILFLYLNAFEISLKQLQKEIRRFACNLTCNLTCNLLSHYAKSIMISTITAIIGAETANNCQSMVHRPRL